MHTALPDDELVELEVTVRPQQSSAVQTLRRYRITIACAALVGALAGEVAVNILPPVYEAQGRLLIIPVDDPTAATSGSAYEMANATLPLVVAVVRSRRVAEETVEQLKLDAQWGISTADARKRLVDRLAVATDRKANLLTVSFEDRVPARAREVVAAIAERATDVSRELWAERNREHRISLERDLAKVGSELSQAEDALRDFRERTHVVDFAAQVKATVEQAAALERLRIDKTLDVRFARAYGQSQTVEVQKGIEERAAAEGELAALRHGAAAGPLLPLDQLPALEVEHARLKRAVDEQAQRHELLALKVSQLVAAEARPGGLAEIVDPPVEPQAAAGPSLVKLVLAGALTAALIASLLVLLAARRQPEAEAA